MREQGKKSVQLWSPAIRHHRACLKNIRLDRQNSFLLPSPCPSSLFLLPLFPSSSLAFTLTGHQKNINWANLDLRCNFLWTSLCALHVEIISARGFLIGERYIRSTRIFVTDKGDNGFSGSVVWATSRGAPLGVGEDDALASS
jgi:hypothetical protein